MNKRNWIVLAVFCLLANGFVQAKEVDVPNSEQHNQTQLDAKLYDAISEGTAKNVVQAIKAGANVNCKGLADLIIVSPLSWAAAIGDEQKVRVLLKRGAHPNSADARGMTPLHWAASVGCLGCVRLLLKKGANPTIKDNEGQAPADVARAPEIKKIIEDWIKQHKK